MKKLISSFSIHQTSKTIALIHFVIIALISIPIGLFQLFNAPDKVEAVFWFIFPIFYAALTYIMIAAWITVYNWISGKVGGIEVTFTDSIQPK